MNNTRYEDFCNRMRVYRKRLGYNQADIGKELGISQNDYSKRENGLIMISYDNLKKLQEIGMDIDELVSGKRDDIDTKDLDELISDCESEELKDMTMRMVAECIKYYRVNDTKNKDNDTQNDRMFDFMLKQWDDFSMLEYVRHETHYSQEVMSEKLGLTRKKYRKYEKEIMYPDADTLVQMYNLYNVSLIFNHTSVTDTLVQMYNLYKCRPSMYLNMYDRRYYVMQNVWMELDDNQRDRILRMVKAIKNII